MHLISRLSVFQHVPNHCATSTTMSPRQKTSSHCLCTVSGTLLPSIRKVFSQLAIDYPSTPRSDVGGEWSKRTHSSTRGVKLASLREPRPIAPAISRLVGERLLSSSPFNEAMSGVDSE